MSKKSPQLRFEGFTDDWELRKLGDTVIEIIAGGDIDKNKVVEFGKYPIYANSHSGDGIVGYYDDFYRVNGPAVTVTGRGEVGFAKARETDFTPVVRLLAIRSKHNHCFLENAINLHGVTVESTGVPQLTVPQLSAYRIYFPYDIQEENQIGTFFSTLDQQITLHQRKLDLLKEQKKGFLQKMFPKNGAKVPELRFAGFADDWEERKLGDVFSERSERSSEGELISVTINSGVVKASELDRKDNSSNDKSNYKKVEVGDIAYNSMRMWQGASGYSSYDGILSPAYTVIIPKEGTDSKFFAYDFKRHDMIQTFKRNSQGLTSDTWNLKFPTLKSVKVMVPCMEEQTKISNFFERLDTTITLHQRKLDLLKEQKKGFLQKMFV